MKLPRSKRLRIVLSALFLNFAIFTTGVIKGSDLSDLGIGLAALNSPLYVYVLGETNRPSNEEDNK